MVGPEWPHVPAATLPTSHFGCDVGWTTTFFNRNDLLQSRWDAKNFFHLAFPHSKPICCHQRLLCQLSFLHCPLAQNMSIASEADSARPAADILQDTLGVANGQALLTSSPAIHQRFMAACSVSGNQIILGQPRAVASRYIPL